MNIFQYELKAYRKSTIIWSLSLAAGIIIFFSMYPAFTKDIAASRKVLEDLPAAVRDAIGLSLSNFFTIFGFYAYLFTFISLAGAVQAMNLGVSVISKESSGKTMDFLLTKPVTRSAVLINKLLAAFTTLAITNAFFITIAYITARAVATEGFSAKIFILISLTLFLIQLFFLCLGSLFAVSIPKIKSVIGISLPTVFAFFILSTLDAILGVGNIRYITPFKFYNIMYIINHGSYETKFLLIELVYIIAFLTASFLIYLKKDMPSAT